jgi:hypothetical protein
MRTPEIRRCPIPEDYHFAIKRRVRNVIKLLLDWNRCRGGAQHQEKRTDTHHIDEGIRFDASLDGIRSVKLIAENGKLTAASASQICDGASGVMVVNGKGLLNGQIGRNPDIR